MIKTIFLFIALIATLYLIITFINSLFNLIRAFEKGDSYESNTFMIIGFITAFLWTLFYYLNL